MEPSMNASADHEAPKPNLKKLGGAFVGLLQGHLELLGLELREEKERTLRLLLLAGISLILVLLILMGLSAALIILFWDTYRIGAILMLCILYGVALYLCARQALQLAKECTHPFQSTLEELARNREKLLP